MQGSEEARAVFEERPSASGSTSDQLPPLCVEANRHRHLFAGLFVGLYKERERAVAGIGRGEDEVLSDRFWTLLSLFPSFLSSIAFLCRVPGRLALFRGTPECFRQHLRPATPPPFPRLCVEANRHRHLFAGLFGCNQPVPHRGL